MSEISQSISPCDIWTEPLNKYCTNSRNTEVTNFPSEFLARLGRISPEILAGQESLSLTEEDTESILDDLVKNLPFRLIKIAQQIFRTGLSAGNERQIWHIPLPPLIVPLPRPTNPVKPRDFELGTVLDVISSKFMGSLAEILRENDPKVLAGAVIFSAAAYGSLATKSKIEALGTVEPSDMEVRGNICRIGLGNLGTWFPTDFPEVILRCFARLYGLPILRKDGGNFAHRVREALYALADALELPSDKKRMLAERLPALCKLQNAVCMPGYLLGYVYETNRSIPLQARGWTRVFSGDRTPLDDEELIPSRTSPGYEKHARTNDENAPPQVKYCREILQSLAALAEHARTVTVAEAIGSIEKLKRDTDDKWPVQIWLADYAIHLIRDTVAKNGAFSSADRYFSEIWYALLTKTLATDPTTFEQASKDDWIDDLVSWRSKSDRRHFFQTALTPFLKFIGVECEFSELDNWVFGASGRTRANLITPWEFDELIEELNRGKYFKDLWKQGVAVLFVVLCYRTGLRGREPTLIRLCDLQLGATPELVLRESEYGKLKSDQATRRIPLKGLLTQHEVDLLLTYRRERAKTALPRDPLFVNPEHPGMPLEPARIFPNITKALRQVTGDPEAIPHLLRHSFCSFGVVRLHAADGVIQLPQAIKAFTHPTFSMAACDGFKNAIFQRDPGDPPATGRRNLYAISMIAGHLSPSTTLGSYFHLADLLVYFFRNREQPEISRAETRAGLLTLTESRMYQIAKKNGVPANQFKLAHILEHLRSLPISQTVG